MPGLMNLGNTCYINSLIQCLGHVKCIREWLLDHEHHHDDGSFTKELADIIHKLWMEEQSLMPRRFVQCVYEKFKFEEGDQHDLNELWMKFVDQLSIEDKEDVDLNDHAKPTSAMNNDLCLLYKAALASWSGYHKKGFHAWDALAEGLLVSQVQCQGCKKLTHNFEPFTSLNMDLLQQTDIVTLEDLLTHTFASETVTEWRCDHCKQAAPSEKVARIWKLPRVLTIVWKRFAFCADKHHFYRISTPVSVPKELHFPHKYVLADDRAVYQLKAIGLHHGAMNYGHYTCLGNVGEKWYHYDDLKVNTASIEGEQINLKEAYVAMYERL